MKKWWGLLGIVGMVFLLTRCCGSGVSEDQMKVDLQAFGGETIVSVACGSNRDSYDLEVSELTVQERERDGNRMTVYCAVTMENEAYRYTADETLHYTYAKGTGWGLEACEAKNDTLIPRTGVTKEIADKEMSRYSFDTCERIGCRFDEEYCETQWIYHVSDRDDGYEGNVELEYFWYSEGKYGYWIPELVYDRE
ncbi:MAG: hypothetical protein Q4F79_04400 [Eubacteriales bacterium]|nr:hypothetical protein [Eubacteriales bacterium]